MSNFRPTDRNTDFLMPPSVDEWLPERHLARFIVDVVEDLDLRAMTGSYRGSGLASYHPTVLLSLLAYGYATLHARQKRLAIVERQAERIEDRMGVTAAPSGNFVCLLRSIDAATSIVTRRSISAPRSSTRRR